MLMNFSLIYFSLSSEDSLIINCIIFLIRATYNCYPAAKTSEFSPRMRFSPLSHKVRTNLGFKAGVKIQGLCDFNSCTR